MPYLHNNSTMQLASPVKSFGLVYERFTDFQTGQDTCLFTVSLSSTTADHGRVGDSINIDNSSQSSCC